MSGAVQIRPVTSRAELEAFIRFPFRLYRDQPHWVPPLLMERRDFYDPAKNPLYEYAQVQLFAALRDGEVVGSIAAVRNDRYGQFHPDDAQVGFFGGFECVPEQAVAEALFNAAGDWLKGQGRTVMRGPVNLTTNDVVGLLVEGFDEDPAVMMPYNLPGYAGQMVAAGFTKSKDLYAYTLTTAEYDGRLEQVAGRLAGRARFQARPVDLKHFASELEFVRTCYNEAWNHNWGFVPWTDRELAFIGKDLKLLVDPRLALMGEIDGKPAGFVISIPDANEAFKLAKGSLFPFGLVRMLWKLKVSRCSRIRTIAMGVLPRYRRFGFEAFLVQRMIANTVKAGYRSAEMSWVLEDNGPMLSMLEQLNAHRTKTYRVYDRAV